MNKMQSAVRIEEIWRTIRKATAEDVPPEPDQQPKPQRRTRRGSYREVLRQYAAKLDREVQWREDGPRVQYLNASGRTRKHCRICGHEFVAHTERQAHCGHCVLWLVDPDRAAQSRR